MNEKLIKVRDKLLMLGYDDNEYLYKYLELIERNLGTPRSSRSTQAHHAIPVKEFIKEAKLHRAGDSRYRWQMTINTAELDEANFRVNLLYADHLRAHNLLALCRNLDEVQRHHEEVYDKKCKRVRSPDKVAKVVMPKYITEDKILNKITYYTTKLEQAVDERAARNARASLSQWRAKHALYQLDPEKYENMK
jgi:hypothetical protein